MNTKKLINYVIYLIFICVSVIPFALGSLTSISNYVDNSNFGLLFFLFALMIFGFLFIIVKCEISIREWKIIIFLFASTLLIRWTAVTFLNTQQTSDFMDMIDVAKRLLNGPFPNILSIFAPHRGYYEIYLSILLKLLGTNLEILKWINCIFAGFTSIGIYLLGNKIISLKNSGLIAALVFIFWPSDILYKSLLTGEHLFIMLAPFACLTFLNATENIQKSKYLSILLFVLSGLIMGVMETYKPVAIIFLLSFILSLFLRDIYIEQSMNITVNSGKKLFLILLISVMIASFYSMKIVNRALFQKAFKDPPNNAFYIYTLRIGLDQEHQGKWNYGFAVHFEDLLVKNNWKIKSVNIMLAEEVKSLIENPNFRLINLMINKFEYTWSSEDEFVFWALSDQTNNGFTSYNKDVFGNFLKSWNNSYYILVMVFSTFGALYAGTIKKNIFLLPIGLFIFGFTVLLLFSEVQQRYRSVLVSVIPIFVTYGIYALVEVSFFVKKKFQIYSKHQV
jgi:hypothetical protein